jgi:hypothetical protein
LSPLLAILGMKIGRHTKGNAKGVKTERPMIRKIPLSRFEKLDLDALVTRLFSASA